MKINILSSALYSTFVAIPEYKLLFDAGDGLVSNLQGDIYKYNKLIFSHAHRDHITGLSQLLQLWSKQPEKKTELYYPSGSRSFPHLREFLNKFDNKNCTDWFPIKDGGEIKLNNNTSVFSYGNDHSGTHNRSKSRGHVLFDIRKKLKPIFKNLDQKQIVELVKDGVDISDIIYKPLLGYAGDTPVTDENLSLFKDCDILIHEGTFLNRDHGNDRWGTHTILYELLEKVNGLNVNHLIINHISKKYSMQMYKNICVEMCVRFNINCNVYLVDHSKYNEDILNNLECLVWNGLN